MIRNAFAMAALAALLLSQSSAAEVADIERQGFDFVLEIAGFVVQRALAEATGKPVVKKLPDGKLEIRVKSVTAEACGRCVPNLQIVADLSITRVCGKTTLTNQAVLVAKADLAITTDKDKGVIVTITALPQDFQLAVDPPDAQGAEACVMGAAAEVAAVLNTKIVLDGLEVLAGSHPQDSGEVEVAAYELGFDWVLQVFRPVRREHWPTPRVFRLGSVFTLVLSETSLREMAMYARNTGRLPPLMGENGLIDPHGTLRVQSVESELDPGWLTLNWHTIARDGKPVPVQWRAAFVEVGDGLALDIRQVTVGGVRQDIAKDQELINPIDQLIRNIAMGRSGTGIFISPLGRLRFTVVEITSNAIMVAGRA